MTQLPDKDGRAWEASGRIADMWLTLVLAFVRGKPATRQRPMLHIGPLRRSERDKCRVCGSFPCPTPISCAGKHLDGLG